MKTIRTKLFVILLLCSTVTMTVFGGISAFFVLKLVKEVETDKLTWMARYYSESFSREMAIIEDKVHDLAIHIEESIDIERLRTDRTYLQDYAESLAPTVKNFADKRTRSIAAWVYFDPKWSDSPHDIYFVDGNGDKKAERQNHIPFSYYNNTPKPDDDKQWWYGPIAKGSGFWTNPYEWTLKNSEVIKVASYAYPLYIDTTFVGVVGTYYRFRRLYEEIADIKPYGNTYASLFNERLDVIIHPFYKEGNRNTSDNLYTVDNGTLKDLAISVHARPYGIIPYNDKGTERFFAYSTLVNGWIFAINPPVAMVYAGLYHLGYTLFLAFMASLFFLGVIAFGTGRVITRPLLALVEAAKALGGGNLAVRVKNTTRDEINDLANAFNTMAQNLKCQQERLSTLIQGVGMCTWTIDGLATRFVFDAHWHTLLGLPGASVPGEWPLAKLYERTHPEDQQILRNLMQAVAENTFLTILLRVRAEDGSWRYLKGIVSIDACLYDGRTALASGVSYDTTAQVKALETEAEQKAELEALVTVRTKELLESRDLAEAASKSKTVFLSTVSHEIRTPMNAILGFTHIFDRSNLTLRQREYLEKIKLSSMTLLNVINDVLDISKIEAGKLELEQEAFRLDTLLDTMLSIVGFAAQDKSLAVTINVDPALPTVFIGDAKRISQIVLNLLNNAIKFTERGSITLTVTRGEARDAVHTCLDFHVVDTGIGLTEEQIDRLFKAFSQADSSITRKYGGTGLGLAICKQIVELMQGTISVTSIPGEGSDFHFSLLLVASDEGMLSGDDATPSQASVMEKLQTLQGIRVLVVEDNMINQEIARALLEECGLYVEIAQDGQVALDVLLTEHYECIFMDMQMPVLDGLESTRRLRACGASGDAATAWLATVPVIAMTANAMAEDRQRCIEAGMNDHISKPLDPVRLKNLLLTWLSRKDVSSETARSSGSI